MPKKHPRQAEHFFFWDSCNVVLHLLMLNIFLERIVCAVKMRRDVNPVARVTLNRSDVRERNDMGLTNIQGYQIIASSSIINLSHPATTLYVGSE